MKTAPAPAHSTTARPLSDNLPASDTLSTLFGKFSVASSPPSRSALKKCEGYYLALVKTELTLSGTHESIAEASRSAFSRFSSMHCLIEILRNEILKERLKTSPWLVFYYFSHGAEPAFKDSPAFVLAMNALNLALALKQEPSSQKKTSIERLLTSSLHFFVFAAPHSPHSLHAVNLAWKAVRSYDSKSAHKKTPRTSFIPVDLILCHLFGLTKTPSPAKNKIRESLYELLARTHLGEFKETPFMLIINFTKHIYPQLLTSKGTLGIAQEIRQRILKSQASASKFATTSWQSRFLARYARLAKTF